MEEENQKTCADITNSRRQFLKLATGILTTFCMAVVGLPLIGAFIGPAFRAARAHWLDVADVTALSAGQPVNLKVTDTQTDAYLQESIIRHLWVIKKSDSEVMVFSPNCTHLGCQYNWNPASGHFECPCHGSVFAPDGKVLGGPAPRRLDTLPVRIDNNRLLVEWQQFRSGIAQKIAV